MRTSIRTLINIYSYLAFVHIQHSNQLNKESKDGYYFKNYLTDATNRPSTDTTTQIHVNYEYFFIVTFILFYALSAYKFKK